MQQPRRREQEDGLTSVEYGVIAAFVGLAFIVTGPSLTTALVNLLDTVLTAILG